MSDDSLDIAMQQLQRILSDQWTQIDGLSTKASVTLGFVLTVFGALFQLGRDSLQAHLPAAILSASLLTGSAVLLVFSYWVSKYRDDPDPTWLIGLIETKESPVVNAQLVANLADAYNANHEGIRKRFRYLNLAMVLFLLGVLVYVGGVVLL